MAYRIEQNGEDIDIVWDGFENGIAVSPHKGIGNMQGVDISTETKEVMVSYARTQQYQSIAGGTLTRINTNTVQTSAGTPLNGVPAAGTWIVVSGSSIGGLSSGNYFVYSANTATRNLVLSSQYDPNGDFIVTGLGAGTATFSTVFNMGEGVQDATEFYVDASHVAQNRYYILDSNGRLWCYDTALASQWNWFLPYTSIITSPALGLGVLNGTLFVFGSNTIFTESTSQLDTGPSAFVYAAALTGLSGSLNPHLALTSHQGKLYWPDGAFIGSIFPNTTLDATTALAVNVQSYAKWADVTNSTTGNISALLSGSVPATSTFGSTSRIPAFFFAGTGGTLPAALSAGTKYYIDYTVGLSTSGHFEVYAAAVGGSAIDIKTGRVGATYFNTFWTSSSDGATTFTFSQERLNLPIFETATCLAELDNQVIIGTRSNILYLWNQIDVTPSDFIALPENNTAKLLTVNNSVFAFSGTQGNIYVTNGSTSSLILTVPAYTTGLIEPYFVWGGAMYLRGRVWFSIQDQTASHTGNCGGIWSFVPTQNFFIGQDTGLQLRMDNRPYDGTFNGRSTLLIPSQNQSARGPQYWDVRTSSVSSPIYTINFSDTLTSVTQPAVIELDIVPTGTLLSKRSFKQLEFKLATSTDAAGAETVSMAWRQNLTDSFTPASASITESTNGYIAGYVPVNFQNTQWIQPQITLTTDGATTSSFLRLIEVRLR